MIDLNKEYTDLTEKRLAAYIKDVALQDECVRKAVQKPNKTMYGVSGYVFHMAKEKAKNARSIMIEDAEVFGWAIHYITEDTLDFEKKEVKRESTYSSYSKPYLRPRPTEPSFEEWQKKNKAKEKNLFSGDLFADEFEVSDRETFIKTVLNPWKETELAKWEKEEADYKVRLAKWEEQQASKNNPSSGSSCEDSEEESDEDDFEEESEDGTEETSDVEEKKENPEDKFFDKDGNFIGDIF
ncbi:MAG: hypothetical protein KBS84_06385 [Treponema sp.]|nr:hypothetical protein [Candidatus Treponema scatequi]